MIEETYIQNKKNLLFYNDSKISTIRKNILEKFKNSLYDKKNSETIANNSNLLKNTNYKFQNNKISGAVQSEKTFYNLNIINGCCNSFNDSQLTLNSLFDKNPEKYFDYNLIPENDYITNLNSLFTNCGYELIIKKNQNVNLVINNLLNEENLTLFQKIFIKCEEGSQITIIDKFENNLTSLMNVFYKLELKKNSKLNHIFIQNSAESSKLFLTSETKCFNNAEYTQNVINFSNGYVRNHHYGDLFELSSQSNFKGLFFISDKNICDNKTFVRHHSANCKSDQIYKGVLSGMSKASYYSGTLVDQNAQKTEGYQLSKGILLSDNSNFFSKPELRIYADDVQCSHGSTIGPIDDNLIFYIRSRGLTTKEATRILVKSFINEDLEKINNNLIIKKIENYLNIYFKKNI